MHDIRLRFATIPKAFDKALARRGLDAEASAKRARSRSTSSDRTSILRDLETAQARRNAASKEIGEAKKSKDEEKAKGLLARSPR